MLVSGRRLRLRQCPLTPSSRSLGRAYHCGSSEEFVGESGESVAANPPANRRGLRPCDPPENQNKNPSKKKEQEAISALPLVGNRARHVVGRFQVASGWTPVGSEPPPQNGLWNEERRRPWNPRSVPPGSKMWLLTC